MTMWQTDIDIQPDHTLHVWPSAETEQHHLHGALCRCHPRLEEQDNGIVMVVHNELRSTQWHS